MSFNKIKIPVIILIVVIVALSVTINIVNEQRKNMLSSEAAVISALQSIIKIEHGKNIDAGNNAWPSENPFVLLGKFAPKNKEFVSGEYPDGVNWRYYHAAPAKAWYIFCPHSNKPAWDNNDALRGRLYIYQYGDTSYKSGEEQHNAGDFWLYKNCEHE